jgi:hypothetical protein
LEIGLGASTTDLLHKPEMTPSQTIFNTAPFKALVGAEIVELIFEKAPTKS